MDTTQRGNSIVDLYMYAAQPLGSMVWRGKCPMASQHSSPTQKKNTLSYERVSELLTSGRLRTEESGRHFVLATPPCERLTAVATRTRIHARLEKYCEGRRQHGPWQR